MAKKMKRKAPLHGDFAKVTFNIPPLSPAPKYVGCKVDIVGSCRVFILLAYVYLDFFYFVIWNPSTGFRKRINNVSMHAHLFSIGCNTSIGDYVAHLYGIGYDSSTDDYVVVIVTLPLLGPRSNGRWSTEVYCFSLRTNSWSFTEVQDLLIGYCAVTGFDLKLWRY
ncbi:F-box/kelch-repeat protein [Spatholobus suberectus]|nr:F-box/kelch-repeat protein [Spatholobus suberectus]